MTAFSAQRVLAVAAHPDDNEIGCGASLSRFLREGAEVYVVSACDCGDIATGAPLSEWEAAMAVFSPTRFANLGMRNRHLGEQGDELRSKLAAIEREFRPDLVFTHSNHDLHQDHAACRLDVERVFRDRTLLGFVSHRSSRHFDPSVWLRVEPEDVARQIESLRQYRSQLTKDYFVPAELEAAARLRGREVNVPLAEAFETIRIVG